MSGILGRRGIVAFLLLLNVGLIFYVQTANSTCHASLEQCLFVQRRRLNCGPLETSASVPTAPPTTPASYARVVVHSLLPQSRITVDRLPDRDVPITLFSAPRAFDADTSARQRAAIVSWALLPGAKEIILLGNEAGVGDTAVELGMRHAPSLTRAPDGVPLMDAMFQQASKMARNVVMCYINADISLPPAWYHTMQQVLPWALAQERPFLIAGPRIVFPESVLWTANESWSAWEARNRDGFRQIIMDGAIDWFVYRRGDFDIMPAFKLGRYVWDSWMVDYAVRHDWITVTTFTTDKDPQTAYGLHWEHSRAHQKSKMPDNEREENWVHARKSGMGQFGRLRGMELALVKDAGYHYVVRRFDREVLGARVLHAHSQPWDALLVGGGPTGAALACALGTHPLTRHLRIALLDAQPYHPSAMASQPVGAPPDARVLALSHASSTLLQSCGAWDAVLASGRATPYYDMHVCDAAGGSVRFHASDAQLPSLGFIVEHTVLCEALYKRMAELDITVLPPAPFDDKTAPPHRLLLGCDGVASTVRRQRGVPSWGWSYRQQAIVTAVRTADPAFIASSAIQRFTPEGGCVALLPSVAGFLSLVYSVPSTAVPGLMAMDGVALADVVTRAMGPTLLASHAPLVECVGVRGAPPLRLQNADRYTDTRMALVGDAAHAVHPLAGQGYNLALNDVSALVAALAWAVETGSDVGGPVVLERYEREAKRRDTVALAAVHGIWTTMQWSGPLTRPLRALGMAAVEAAPPLRRLLVEQAAGASFVVQNQW